MAENTLNYRKLTQMSMNVLNSELEITGGCVQSWVWIFLKPVPDCGQNSRLK
jgi:hypothetical protein